MINIDQSPIGRTPRSNPATYTGLFTPIRELFASVPEARLRGYQPGRFSFNVKGGRCEACQGEGYIEIEMQFLPDVTVPCEVCKGKRYNREALEILFRGKNIAEVLEMTVDEALRVLQRLPARCERSSRRCRTSASATSRSASRRRRSPAARRSASSSRPSSRAARPAARSTSSTSRRPASRFEDVRNLLAVLQRLADGGNTVVVIEHHLDVMLNADHIIDLGPLGGDRGGEHRRRGHAGRGRRHPTSLTGFHLREAFERRGIHIAGTNGTKPAKAPGAKTNGTKSARRHETAATTKTSPGGGEEGSSEGEGEGVAPDASLVAPVRRRRHPLAVIARAGRDGALGLPQPRRPQRMERTSRPRDGTACLPRLRSGQPVAGEHRET